jgi:limonene-1,2-epoxide hydrolase
MIRADVSRADTIRAYYAAWVADDLDAVLAMCTEDVVAVNVPIGPLNGKVEVRGFFAKFGRGMSARRYDVLRIVESGDVAMVEGVEHYVRGGRQVSLPYMSTFQFAGALICGWRDYFDVQTVLRQLDLPLDGSRPVAAGGAGSR